MTYGIIPNGKQQFINSNGQPLAAGSVYYYIPSTTTFKNTYQNDSGTVLNTNPIILDANGQCVAYGTGSYRQQVYDVYNNLIWDIQVDSPLQSTDIPGIVEPIYSASNGATLIGYNEGGTGAVTETVAAKLQQTVSVKDFGAAGDGVTDDTTAIQNAINSLTSGTVYLPTGNYVCGQLTLKSGVSLQGNGYSSHFVVKAIAVDFLTGSSLTYTNLKDFSADLTNQTSGSFAAVTGITDSEWSGLYVYNAASFGWLVFTANRCKFLRNTINLTRQWDGMTISTGSTDNVIEGNIVYNSYDSGIGFTDTVGTVCVGNYVNRSGATQSGSFYAPGIDAAGAINATITGNFVIGNQFGISLLQHPNSGQNPKRVACTGNTVADSLYGIMLGQTTPVPPAVTVGILEEIVISGNKIFNASVQGIHFDTCQNITASGNDISYSGQGIYLTGASYITINGNTTNLNSGYGINFGTSLSYIYLLNNVSTGNTSGDYTGLYPTNLRGSNNFNSTGPDLVYSSIAGSNYLPSFYTVAGLPVSGIGTRAFVSDATSPSFLATVVGGGSVKCPVFYNGTNWIVG